MKRGGPIQRRTPMTRGKPIARGTPMARGGAREPRRAPIKAKAPRRGPMDPEARQACFDRAGGLCDYCGRHLNPEAWDCHHRKLRSRRGDDSPENLVALHPGCHSWVHLNPREATELGFMVPSGADPATTPVRRHLATYVIPSDTRWITPARSEE